MPNSLVVSWASAKSIDLDYHLKVVECRTKAIRSMEARKVLLQHHLGLLWAHLDMKVEREAAIGSGISG